MGVTVLALALILLCGGGYFASQSWKRRDYGTAIRTFKLMALGAGVYLAVLVGVSLTSPETDVGPGGDVPLCGLSLNCDRTASVVDVRRKGNLGDPPAELIAQGAFYLVTVKVTSYAANPRFDPEDLGGYVIEARGRRYERFLPGERAVAAARGGSSVFDLQTGPSGGSFKKILVFQAPYDVQNPALVVEDGNIVERVLTWFVIGNDQSLLHRPVKLPLVLPERAEFREPAFTARQDGSGKSLTAL